MEKDDIHFYLAQRLQQKSAELQELTKRLFELQQVKDQERESYETQLQSLGNYSSISNPTLTSNSKK